MKGTKFDFLKLISKILNRYLKKCLRGRNRKKHSLARSSSPKQGSYLDRKKKKFLKFISKQKKGSKSAQQQRPSFGARPGLVF